MFEFEVGELGRWIGMWCLSFLDSFRGRGGENREMR
jgi:hypothetical protein